MTFVRAIAIHGRDVGRLAGRFAVVASLAATLAGCYTASRESVETIPSDYREAAGQTADVAAMHGDRADECHRTDLLALNP